MRVLGVHPGPLMYSRIFLRLEPLGLECVAEQVRKAGHQVRLIDLQVSSHRDFFRLLDRWRPEIIALAGNYLANVPEIIDLAKEAHRRLPQAFILVGGHSASFTAREILDDAEGAIDCVLRGEGEAGIVPLLEAIANDRGALTSVPGVVTLDGAGPPPGFAADLDDCRPARDLLPHRRKYFIGHLDPAASIEFSRGCPWDCSFCSAWTFYGRSYRMVSPERAVDELASIREPGVFIVDDVAFIREQHGTAIGEGIARRGIRKNYYLETRGDVLLRNKDVFKLWRRLGLQYLFIGLEAIDEEGLGRFRKRVPLGRNFEALEYARSLGVEVAVNLIADPDWDERRFETVRQWCLEVPEIVNISVNTPYPGTESWHTEPRPLTTRDYRLFDIQHAVLPTRLPLDRFYAELVRTQRVLNTKHLGWRALGRVAGAAAGRLLRGQTNFLRMLWKFDSVYNPDLLLADHQRPVRYRVPLRPSGGGESEDRQRLYVHQPR
ncbi:MAG: hopanoid C-3 methylase HpnR [Magnetospirillum sp.]|nr:hopanoid C-3 methylase HpnR [Magnetospirillum sp.]